MMKKSLTEVIHQTAKGLYEAGIMEAQTMRKFDALCLPPIKKYNPREIKRIRLRNKTSQAVLALYLNTSTSTIQKWEQGTKKPNGLALRVLNLIDKKGLSIFGN